VQVAAILKEFPEALIVVLTSYEGDARVARPFIRGMCKSSTVSCGRCARKSETASILSWAGATTLKLPSRSNNAQSPSLMAGGRPRSGRSSSDEDGPGAPSATSGAGRDAKERTAAIMVFISSLLRRPPQLNERAPYVQAIQATCQPVLD
jgi:hypothetical protein